MVTPEGFFQCFVRYKKIKFHLTYTHYRDTTHRGYNSNVNTI